MIFKFDQGGITPPYVAYQPVIVSDKRTSAIPEEAAAAKVASDAAIKGSKLADASNNPDAPTGITTEKIENGAITTAKLDTQYFVKNETVGFVAPVRVPLDKGIQWSQQINPNQPWSSLFLKSAPIKSLNTKKTLILPYTDGTLATKEQIENGEIIAQTSQNATNATYAQKTDFSNAEWITHESNTDKVSVNYDGIKGNFPDISYIFREYRYRGELSSVPSDYVSAIKGLDTQELNETATLGSTNLPANKYYLFAVVGNKTLICRHAATGGLISGTVTGTCQIPRQNGTKNDNTYSYILVPKSEIAWAFTITNS